MEEKIVALKAAGKQEEERQVIEEVCRYWSDKVADYLTWKSIWSIPSTCRNMDR